MTINEILHELKNLKAICPESCSPADQFNSGYRLALTNVAQRIATIENSQKVIEGIEALLIKEIINEQETIHQNVLFQNVQAQY